MNVAILSRMSTQDLGSSKICPGPARWELCHHIEKIFELVVTRRETRIILHSEEKLISHGEEGGRGRFIGFQTGPGILGGPLTWSPSLLREEQR